MGNRPLSPHLTVYKPQITSVLSILHRITGLFIFIGLFYLSWLIIFSNFSELIFASEILSFNKTLFSSIIGKSLLLLWTFAFCYHFCNGIRHLTWDAGYGFSITAVKTSGVIVLISSATLAALIWHYSVSNLF